MLDSPLLAPIAVAGTGHGRATLVYQASWTSDNSLSVPLECGLLGPIPTSIYAGAISARFGDSDAGSNGMACCLFAFLLSVIRMLKLHTNICSYKHYG
jgi:hypothetical protein